MATKKTPAKKAAPSKVVPAKAAPAKKPVVAKAKPTPPPTAPPVDKKAALQKQMEALQAQMQELARGEVHELKLKLSDARKVVSNLEHELAQLTGKPSGPVIRKRRERRPAITDDVLKDQILKVMASRSKSGMNGRQIAEAVQQDPIRVRKFIGDNPKILKKTGAGAATKFFLP